MSFGGGFGGGDLTRRAEILLKIGVEGTTETDKINLALKEAADYVRAVRKDMDDGKITFRDYLSLIKTTEAWIGTLTKRQKDLEAATKGSTAATKEQTAATTGQTQASQKSEEQILQETIALRQQQNMIAGVARERKHLNDVIAEGATMQVSTATFTGRDQFSELDEVFTQVTSKAEQGKDKFKQLTFSVLAAGHAFQDLTSSQGDWARGLAATLNNIPLLVTGVASVMGASTENAMLLAGGLTVVASAAMAVYQNWDKIEDAMGTGIPRPVLDTTDELGRKLKEASKEFEGLATQTRMTLPELNRYKELNEKIVALEKEKKAAMEWQKLGEAQSKESRAVGQGVTEAITEAGGRDAAMEAIYDALYNVGTQTGQTFTVEGLKAQAQQMIQDATRGDQYSKDARNQITKLLGQFGGAGGANLLSQIKTFAPETAEEKRRAQALGQFEEKVEREVEQGANEARRKAKALGQFELKIERELEQGAKKAAGDRAARVNDAASEFGTKFAQMSQMENAMLARAAQGQDMSAGMADQLAPYLAGKVANDIIPDVAEKVAQQVRDRMEAEIVGQAAGLNVPAARAGQAGAMAALAARNEKQANLDEQMFNKQAREAGQFQEQMAAQGMMQQIAMEAGGRLGEGGVIQATGIAMRELKQHGNERRAVDNAIMQTMLDLAGELQAQRQFNANMANRLGQVGAQGGRQRARRAGLGGNFRQW